MIQILIVTHADMAKGILSSAELIMGPQKDIATIGLCGEDSFESFNEKVRGKLTELYNEDGVLVFVDLYGGTPCNVTAANVNRPVNGKTPHCECVSGVNLPMLIEALSMRESMTLEELKDHCITTASEGVKDIKKEFNLLG